MPRTKNSRNSSIFDSSRPKRRRGSNSSQSFDTTSLSNYSILTDDLETNEIVVRLKSMDPNERLYCVDTLSKIFADPESNLAEENPSLWADYLSRFFDASKDVRFHMAQAAVDICCKRPDLRNDTIGPLVKRSLDPEEDIRHEVVSTIASIMRHDRPKVNEDLLSVLKERILDKKYKVRREALLALASLYRNRDSLQSKEENWNWIKNKILHAYYQCGADDKLLCEKLIYTTLAPHSLEIEERMDALFSVYCSVDSHAVKAFNEVLRQQNILRRLVRSILELRKKEDRDENEIAIKTRSLGDRFPNPSKVTDQLKELFDFLSSDEESFHLVEYLVGDDFTSSDVVDAIKSLFARVGPDGKMANLQAITRLLLERCAPVLVDAEGIGILVNKAMATLAGSVSVDHVPDEQLFQRTFSLLLVLSCSFPLLFKDAEVENAMLTFLQHGNAMAAKTALRILSHCCKEIPGFLSEDVEEKLLPELLNLLSAGDPDTAKHAAICLVGSINQIAIIDEVLKDMEQKLSFVSHGVESALAVFTAVAKTASSQVRRKLSSAASIIVKNIILNTEYVTSTSDDTKEWRPIDELSLEARAMVAGIKFLPRWVIGQESNGKENATKTITLLCSILDNDGDVKKAGKLSYAEKAAMRLSASLAILKLMQDKRFINLLTMVKFRVLAKVVVDECPQVRERFASKLHIALHGLKLPLEFMAIYCLTPTLRLLPMVDSKTVDIYKRHIHSCIMDNVFIRREFIHRPEEFLPEYYLSYVVYLLSTLESYVSYDDEDSLHEIQQCLEFAMEPLLDHSGLDVVHQQFLHKLFLDIKQTRNRERPDDEEQNKKMWAVCDLALVLLTRRVPNFVLKDTTYKSLLPAKCFTSPMKTKTNTDVYLPHKMLPKGFDKSSLDITK